MAKVFYNCGIAISSDNGSTWTDISDISATVSINTNLSQADSSDFASGGWYEGVDEQNSWDWSLEGQYTPSKHPTIVAWQSRASGAGRLIRFRPEGDGSTLPQGVGHTVGVQVGRNLGVTGVGSLSMSGTGSGAFDETPQS